MVQRRVERLALGAAPLSVVLWSSAFVGIRAVASDLSRGSITLGRLTIGTLVTMIVRERIAQLDERRRS